MAYDKSNVELRAARPSDLSLLCGWDRKPHIISARGADGEPDDSYWQTALSRQVRWRDLLIAEIAGRPIGLVQIIDPAQEETHYWGEIEQNLRAVDVWIGEEKNIGRGYGSQMMRLAFTRCFADPSVSSIVVDPLVRNIQAHRFYEHLGFRRVDRRMFGSDDCFVYQLDRDDWQRTKPR